MKLDIYCFSDTGLVRGSNQDMLSIGPLLVRDAQECHSIELSPTDRYMLAVADGMGGHGCGETASSHTLERFRAALYDKSSDWSRPDSMIVSTLRDISAELNGMSRQGGLDRPMGCTFSGLVWAEGKTVLVNVGDSRTYRMRGSILKLMTRDQNLLERDMTPLPEGKVLYSCVGGGTMPDVVTTDVSGKLLPGDRFLICSDGLTDMLQEARIEELMSVRRAAEAGSGLAAEALRAGGRDNISIIVADVVTQTPLYTDGSEKDGDNAFTTGDNTKSDIS